jgi:restriction system protein
MSASIPFGHLRMAARSYAIPQIEILGPRLVVVLGQAVYNAIAVETDNPKRATQAEAIANPFEVSGSKVWCQAHPGARGQNTRNRFNPNQTMLDWLEMSDWYKQNAA